MSPFTTLIVWILWGCIGWTAFLIQTKNLYKAINRRNGYLDFQQRYYEKMSAMQQKKRTPGSSIRMDDMPNVYEKTKEIRGKRDNRGNNIINKRGQKKIS